MTFTPHPINPDLDLELIREIPVSAKDVFDAWTDPDSVRHWFAPRPCTTPLCEIDLRPGGGFRTVMNDPDGNVMMDSTGCYLVIEPGERLIWTSALTKDYRPQQSGMPFTVVLELAANASGGCRYRVIAVHEDPAGARQHAAMGFHEGWGVVVDQIVEHLQSTASRQMAKPS